MTAEATKLICSFIIRGAGHATHSSHPLRAGKGKEDSLYFRLVVHPRQRIRVAQHRDGVHGGRRLRGRGGQGARFFLPCVFLFSLFLPPLSEGTSRPERRVADKIFRPPLPFAQEMCYACFDSLVAHFSGDKLKPPAYENHFWCVRVFLVHLLVRARLGIACREIKNLARKKPKKKKKKKGC